MENKFAKKSVSAVKSERRYTIRYPFAADVEILELETGNRSTGITSDISLGGCFICSSKPLPLNARVRVLMSRKSQSVEALAVVRVFKPRIGMGIEFIDVEPPGGNTLANWIEQLRRSRS